MDSLLLFDAPDASQPAPGRGQVRVDASKACELHWREIAELGAVHASQAVEEELAMDPPPAWWRPASKAERSEGSGAWRRSRALRSVDAELRLQASGLAWALRMVELCDPAMRVLAIEALADMCARPHRLGMVRTLRGCALHLLADGPPPEEADKCSGERGDWAGWGRQVVMIAHGARYLGRGAERFGDPRMADCGFQERELEQVAGSLNGLLDAGFMSALMARREAEALRSMDLAGGMGAAARRGGL